MFHKIRLGDTGLFLFILIFLAGLPQHAQIAVRAVMNGNFQPLYICGRPIMRLTTTGVMYINYLVYDHHLQQ